MNATMKMWKRRLFKAPRRHITSTVKSICGNVKYAFSGYDGVEITFVAFAIGAMLTLAGLMGFLIINGIYDDKPADPVEISKQVSASACVRDAIKIRVDDKHYSLKIITRGTLQTIVTQCNNAEVALKQQQGIVGLD